MDQTQVINLRGPRKFIGAINDGGINSVNEIPALQT